MDAAHLFGEIVAQQKPVHSLAYSGLSAFEDLTKGGLIEERGMVSSIVCEDCKTPHEAEVVFENHRYGYFCPEFGFVPKERSELIATTPNIAAFVGQLSESLNCKRRKSTPIAGATWRIGAIETPAADLVVYFQPTLHDAHDLRDFQNALAIEVKANFGVIITAAGSLTIAPFKTVTIDDCLMFDTSTYCFGTGLDLPSISGVPIIRTGGRPSEYAKKLSSIIQYRIAAGFSLQGRNEEARAILQNYKLKFPNDRFPSLPTVQRHLTKIRNGS